MKRLKDQMTANRFKRELVELREQVKAAQGERDYAEWKRKTDDAIAKINARIRATN